jgi:hypothetical protein
MVKGKDERNSQSGVDPARIGPPNFRELQKKMGTFADYTVGWIINKKYCAIKDKTKISIET